MSSLSKHSFIKSIQFYIPTLILLFSVFNEFDFNYLKIEYFSFKFFSMISFSLNFEYNSKCSDIL